ncbi:TlpA family protein disulfide reductase [Nonomuraea rhodomycinica]|uniref:Thioredoxin family protein n=1 Tax=Nonomuraea rhodomycinica TaxID=1712872 RepID=A0A7Y6MER9_9ACTN|nr:thioredoxin family protein [Nonomuraea rhodomycinica]NUW45843.1 thioredoxin family protein [Nonomuraea rhodomycinica]
MTGVWVVLATLALGTGIGVVRLRRDGRMRDMSGDRAGDGRGDRLTAEALGVPLGPRATLVQFSTAFCQPCRATRRVLADVSALVPGVAHVEIDAESRLDLVRELDILRTPTVLVLDPSGNIVKRASGQPRKADVLTALAAAVPPAQPDSETITSQEPDEM